MDERRAAIFNGITVPCGVEWVLSPIVHLISNDPNILFFRSSAKPGVAGLAPRQSLPWHAQAILGLRTNSFGEFEPDRLKAYNIGTD